MTPVVHAQGLAVNRLSLLNESRTIRRIYQSHESVMIKIFSYLSFWVVIDWINIVSSINFAAQAAFLYGFRLPVAESGRLARPSGAACAKKGGHLGACSVRRNWYRSLSTSLVPPWYLRKASESSGKLAAFWKNPESICSKSQNFKSSKIQHHSHFWQKLRKFIKNQQKISNF